MPGKNIRPLGGIPLIEWSIRVGLPLADVVDVLVSTDDSAIAEVARRAGALVPWLRPATLSTDTASSFDASLHALDWYEQACGKVDGLLLLQPTSPFRDPARLGQGIELFRADRSRTVIGVSPVRRHPRWCFAVADGSLVPYLPGTSIEVRSQDLPPAYAINGAFYLIAPDALRRQRSFFGDACVPLVMDRPWEDIDIDTELDWTIAEAILSKRSALGMPDLQHNLDAGV